MTTDTPNVISVMAGQHQELTADRADLHVTVKGTSLFTGDQALKKAREVAQLVSDLTGFGVPMQDITLVGVSAEVSSGTVLKSSQATYRLRVHCSRLDSLADTIGLIANQKNTTLRAIEWGYPDTQEMQEQWLAECITWANKRAARIAEGLGVRLVGVHQFTENYLDPEANVGQEIVLLTAGSPDLRRRSQAMTGEDLGLEVSHRKTVQIRVNVMYRVSGYE